MQPRRPSLHEPAPREPVAPAGARMQTAGRRSIDAVLAELLTSIRALPDQMRQAITDQLWGDIPVTISEPGFSPNLAAGGTLGVFAQTGALELITSIVISVPTGSTGTLQLGNPVTGVQLPVPAGVTALTGLRHLLTKSDLRQLTIAGGAGGPTGLWLMGEQRPTFGVMAP